MPFSTVLSTSFSAFSVFAVGVARQDSSESVDSCSMSFALPQGCL